MSGDGSPAHWGDRYLPLGAVGVDFMRGGTGTHCYWWLVVAILLVALSAVARPAQAGDEEKPGVTGKNAKIQLSGTGWFVYRYLLADETRQTAPKGFLSRDGVDRKDAASFDLDRVHVTGDYLFNDRISWRTVLEGDNQGGAYRLYIKNGYLRVKEPWGLKAASFKFGVFGHGMTGTIDDLWGYRAVSENSLNRYLGVSSVYAGAGVDARLARGLVDLDLGVANEFGYSTPAADGKANRSKYETFMGRAILTPPGDDPVLRSLHLALFAQRNGKEPVSQSDARYRPASALPRSACDNRNLWLEIFPYFKTERIALGFEFVSAWSSYTRQDVRASAPLEKFDIRSRYIGGVATYQILPKIGCFARIDRYDPNIDTDGSWSSKETSPAVAANAEKLKELTVTTVLAGISHSYANGVRSILDLEYSTFESPKHLRTKSELSLDPDVTVSARMELKL